LTDAIEIKSAGSGSCRHAGGQLRLWSNLLRSLLHT
jgi:hypothetical protein